MKSENKKKDFYYDCDAFNILFTICGCSKDKDKDISKKQLYASICNPNMQGVKEALKNHAELAKETIKTSSKTKPLELAVREIESEKIQLQICSQLIKSGADVNEKGIDGDTNLCWAIGNDRFDLANQLLDAGADPNQKGDEITALKGTVSRISFENYNEKMDMLNRLLESGAKPDSDIISFLLNDDNSNWGMQYYFTPQILKKLEKYDGKQNISQGLRAAMNGDDHKLQKLVISDKINKKDKGQVLAFAAAHCNVDTLKIMKKQGYDFAWKDSDKVGLLQIAALCNHSSVVKYLLEQQLNSKAKADYYKVRAVEFAIVAGNLDNAKILIEKDKVNFKKNHHGKPCDVWEFILAFGDKKSFKTLDSLGHQPTKEEIYDTYQNYGKEQYEQGVKVKEDEVRQYSYDANGNQTDVKNTKTGQTESYTYDAENRLSKVSVTDKDGKTAVIQQNRYNGDGQRIQKVEGSKTTNYYYQDGVVSYTTDGDNIQTSQNLIGTDGNILATQRYGSDHTDYLLYHKDIQGSSTSLVKEDGSADATYQYTDFGETTINGDNKAENEVCYTGGIYDQSTGLYYLNARYYNPEDGGFLTEDTYRGETDEPDTQNLYVYCANNPVNYVDPSGHKKSKTIDITGEFDTTMRLNALQLQQKLEAALDKYWYYAGIRDIAKVFKLFYNKVKSGGDWDFKVQKKWKLKSGYKYLYRESKKKKKYFKRNDDIGNVHYGFVGSALFSKFTLCAGAGAYQVYTDIKNKRKTQVFKLSFGDDAHDTEMIKYGISLYHKWGGAKSYNARLKRKKVRFLARGVRMIFK